VTYDPLSRLLLTPVDPQAPERVRRMRVLGVGEHAEPAFDACARRLARATSAPYAMVTFVGEERQFRAGLYAPPGAGEDRVLARDRGFCPHVVVRRRALVLDDVADFPRFATNPLVDENGIRAYLGAPLVDDGGMVLGTVCACDTAPRCWGPEALATAKSLAAEVAHEILRRQGGRTSA
jgi:GAF domain-containing protein